jgi:hypothetical protein
MMTCHITMSLYRKHDRITQHTIIDKEDKETTHSHTKHEKVAEHTLCKKFVGSMCIKLKPLRSALCKGKQPIIHT